MRKFNLLMAGLCWLATANAQTILSENFETGNTGNSPTPITVGEGWTVVNSYTGTETEYTWHNYYTDPTVQGGTAIEGSNCASVSGPVYQGHTPDGYGPREEILLSPEINLDDTYQLQFSWSVSPMNHYDDSRYDLQVRVVTDGNLAGAETVFSIQTERMLRESGVPVFPIESWAPYTSRINLSDFKGEKVKLAFVYKMEKNIGNRACVDAITVSKFTPPTTPVAAISLDRLTFNDVFIGEKRYSDILTLTNTGTDGLTVSSVDLPAGYSLTFGPSEINLDTYKSVNFRVLYEASLTSATQGNIVFHTNGGDVTIAVSASKKFVPDGQTLETFEEYFPPAGWSNSGWGRSGSALEGNYSAFSDGGYTRSVLTSPRLDLSNGGALSFRYMAYFSSDDPDAAPEYDVTVEVSNDGGETWKAIWTADYQRMNEAIDIDLQLPQGSGNDLVRWIYPIVETTDEGAAPHYTFYMDLVMLPNIVGADGAPKAATDPVPADQTSDIYPADITLRWAPAQFAKGYRLYVGSNPEANNLVNGMDLGDKRTYTIATCDYETTYRWKVVPYNDNGDCRNVPVWSFTTQPDAAVSKYPYEENFSNGFPTGWLNIPAEDTYGKTWSINSIYPYVFDNKKYSVLYDGWLNPEDECAVITPEFKLPAGNASVISFAWGGSHPSDMVIDETGLVKKQNLEPDNGSGILYFEILADGEWKELSRLSDAPIEAGTKKRYWINETVDLTEFQGKTVKFRWRDHSLSSKHDGVSLTHIVVDARNDNKAEFNRSSWDAGKVNCEKSVKSGKIFTLLNTGVAAQKIAKVETGHPNFSTSLKAGDEIAAASGLEFEMEFSALKTAELSAPARVDDMLTVTFESGLTVKLPVSGTALPANIRYFSFEPNDNELKWDDNFTMIDADGGISYTFYSPSMVYPLSNRRGAFCVAYDGEEDGLWGIMKPVSGMHALVAPSPQERKADNWLISTQLQATSTSRLEFYARNWDCLGTIDPDPEHIISVLVSTSGNTDTADFHEVMPAEMIPLLEGDNWKHYEVDLGAYAGQDIYVALRHTTDNPSNVSFYDDLTFHNFDDTTGIQCIDNTIDDNAEVEAYSIGGILVASGRGMETLRPLDKGHYVVKVRSNGTVRTISIIK